MPAFRFLLILCVAATLAGCRKAPPAATTRPTAAPTLASLVPAATDLLLAMGAGDHLVAVSNLDVDRDGIRGLPRVGDYHSTDWETLTRLRPQVMVTQIEEPKLPTGFRRRAAELGTRLINIRIDRLDDIYAAITTLGQAVGETQAAEALSARLHGRIDTVRQRVAGREPTAVLIVIDEDARSVVGPRNFLDDLLIAAGGRNLAAGLEKDYPQIDREQLVRLAPQVIIQLLSDAPPQLQEAAKRFWSRMPDLPAVQNNRVHILTDWHVLLPASHVDELAERFAEILHPMPPVSSPAESSVGHRTDTAGEDTGGTRLQAVKP